MSDPMQDAVNAPVIECPSCRIMTSKKIIKGVCKPCYDKARYPLRREIVSKQGKAYYRENSEAIRDCVRKYAELNKEQIVERNRNYHSANKERLNAEKKEYYSVNKDLYPQYAAARRVKNIGHVVYALVCSVTKRAYVGSTSNMTHRIECHGAALRAGTHKCRALQSSYNLYGPAAFKFVRLISVLNKTDLLAMEQYQMDNTKLKYNSNRALI
jgi:hypothetical protein